MDADFIQKVQGLMQLLQYRSEEKKNKNKHRWLTRKRPPLLWLSDRDESEIFNLLWKLADKDKIQIMNQLLLWIEEYPDMPPTNVPKVCIGFMKKAAEDKVLLDVTLSRISSFRRSFRQFAMSPTPNKVAPEVTLLPPPTPSNCSRRSVTFNEIPIINIINKV